MACAHNLTSRRYKKRGRLPHIFFYALRGKKRFIFSFFSVACLLCAQKLPQITITLVSLAGYPYNCRV
jgi:hypothetical protein